MPNVRSLTLATTAPLIVWLASAYAVASAAPRYVAALADGSRVEGETLRDWHASGAAPHLDGQPLFADGRPLAWLIDRKKLPRPPATSYVEMTTGDVLPGIVAAWRFGGETPYEPAPAHLVVDPLGELRPVQPAIDSRVRVLASCVKRIVWSRRGDDRYRPGEAFLRDGRSLTFRAARFREEGVDLLVDAETRRLRFTDIAELHLPETDAWRAWMEELAVLSPDGAGRMLQLETVGGLKATASLARFEPASHGDAGQSVNWVHGVQPAWSRDLLWIPVADVFTWRSWSPWEAPLSRLAPVERRTVELLAGRSFPHRTDRNVLGGPLCSLSREYGWGFGVHSGGELRLPVPSLAVAFRTVVGIDRMAGKGGCVRARVSIDSAGASAPTRLFESSHLIGAEALADTGALSMAPPANDSAPARTLVLEIDPAHKDRPAGADPFNIRDLANWFEPMLTLDAERVRKEISQINGTAPLAKQGWRMTPVDVASANLKWINFRDEMHPSPGRFRLGLASRGSAVAFSRELTIKPEDRWLVVGISRPFDRGPAPRVEVRIDGETVLEAEIPRRDRNSPYPPPLVVSLDGFQGKVPVRIAQSPAAEELPIRHDFVRLVEQSPRLFRVLEDEEAFQAEGAEASWNTLDRQTGSASLRVSKGGRCRLTWPGVVSIRERPRWGEYRLLRFAFRKFGEGRVAVELTPVDPARDVMLLDAGQGDPVRLEAKRIHDQRLTSDWITITRDLFADYGEIDLSGLSLEVPDGEHAFFDTVCFAREYDDLAALAVAPAEFLDRHKWPEQLKPAMERAASATVHIEWPGQAPSSGVIIDGEGHVLTAGHLVVAPGRAATVRLSDGRTMLAQTRGVCRDADVGMLKITTSGPFPFAEIQFDRNLAPAAPYIATGVRDGAVAAEPVLLRRLLPDALWTNVESQGQLFDAYGRLVGARFRSAGDQGQMHARLVDAQGLIQRMKNSEVWGAWRARCGPELDLSIERLQVREARAGFSAGDLLVKIDGSPLVGDEDIETTLAAKDPGQSVTITVNRGGQMVDIPVVLSPRTND